MKTNELFTEEELLYIEKTMDIQASYQDKTIHQICEDFMISKVANNEELSRLISTRIMENGQSQLLTKSIRDKIEGLRK